MSLARFARSPIIYIVRAIFVLITRKEGGAYFLNSCQNSLLACMCHVLITPNEAERDFELVNELHGQKNNRYASYIYGRTEERKAEDKT